MIAARMEKRGIETGGRVRRNAVCVFRVIATLAGQGQIAFIIITAHSKSNDMFDRKLFGGKAFPTNTVLAVLFGGKAFPTNTLLAVLFGTLTNQAPHLLGNVLSSHADMA
jgi:hypothetical protein